VSKSKISPHKHKTEEQHTSDKTDTAQGSIKDQVQHASEATVSGAEKLHQVHGEDGQTSVTAIKGILKRPKEDRTSKLSSTEDSSRVESANQLRTTITSSTIIEKKNTEAFDLDDTEQPFASLTDEEKQIIGLVSHPPIIIASGTDVLGANKSSDSKTFLASSPTNISSCNSNTSAAAAIGKQGVGSSEQDASNEAEVVEFKNSSSDKSLPCSEVKEEAADELLTNSSQGCTEQRHDLTVNKEKADTSSRKRKSVQLKAPLLDVTCKKRKSQQLLCVTDCLPTEPAAKYMEEVSELKNLKGHESSIKPETTLDQFLKSSSKSLEEIDYSMKKSLLGKGSTTQGNGHSLSKEQKCILNNAVTLKQKTSVKESSVENTHIPKKKANIADAEINFFGSTKKSIKNSKVEKEKRRKEKTPTVKTSKDTNLETKELRKSKALKQKFSKGITILISDDSDTFSPAHCESSSEEDSHLKRIWDDFEPQNDSVSVEDSSSPIKHQKQNLSGKKMPPGAAKANGTEKQTSLVDTLGLGKKQRVAHTSNHLPRRLSSNANPVRRYPKTLSAVQKKDEPVTSSSTSVESPASATHSYKPAKQRVAHVVKNTAPAGSLPRPRIPVEYGAKVPQNQRQRYLDRIIDEYLRICPTEKEAFEKAVEEEKALYERSTRRQVYLNLCVNAIKKLRDMTPQEMAISSPIKTETERRVAVTKTLPSGAVLISTKSPAKQEQPVMPASDDLTEDVMYDFLSKYLLSEEDLVENGYPRPCPTTPGKAVFKTKKEQPSKDSSRRTCRRCGKPFVVLEDGVYLTREECVYHAGRLFRKRGEQITSYSCCQGDAGSPGCCVGKVHVSDDTCNTDGFMTTIVSPLTDRRKKIFAMDCEMCYTTAGLELTRITVVNWNLEGVYDTFVMPERTIVDYNTRFSGVTEESLRGVTTTIREVQAVLLSMIHKDTILVGHSLESDLKATKLIHSKVVDTSVVFPHRLGPPYKRALRNLMADYLKKIIQDSVEGHDSCEDAKACLELMRWKVKEDLKRTTRHKSPRLSLG